MEYSKIEKRCIYCDNKTNLFPTNMKRAFIPKNSLKVIIRPVYLLISVPYKDGAITEKL